MSTINAPVPMTVSCDNKAVQMNVGMKITTGTTSVTDKEPYLFRASAAGSADVAVNKIIGGTVAWNQLLDGSADANWGVNNATKSFTNGICTFTASAKDGYVQLNVTRTEKDHVYLAIVDIKETTATNLVALNFYGSDYKYCEATTNWQRVASINKRSASNNNFKMRVSDRRTSGWDAVQVKNFMLFDLTAMFGSTIADYIYALEQSNSGSGVAYFRKLFPKPYYAYNSGELLSVQTSAHRVVGFNQWDEEWELGSLSSSGEPIAQTNTIRSTNYCKCFPNTAYYVRSPKTDGGSQNRYYIKIVWYGADKSFISGSWENNRVVTSPNNASYFKIHTNTSTVVYGSTYLNDICINLSGERNGEYEPYEAHTYALDDVELRGIPKLDASNNLYYDGDTYESDGTVTRRYAIRAFTSGDATDGSTMITDGTNTVYKLATPTTETADPYTNPQKVDASGTEEYVDSREVPIPVGHETQYVTRQTAETSVDAYPMTVTHGIEV